VKLWNENALFESWSKRGKKTKGEENEGGRRQKEEISTEQLMRTLNFLGDHVGGLLFGFRQACFGSHGPKIFQTPQQACV